MGQHGALCYIHCRAMVLLIPMNIVMLALCSMMGIIAYGYFAARGCDPYAGGLINNMNQVSQLDGH